MGDMKKYESILHLLRENENEYVSGEEIAEKLGKTRAYVWKGIAALRKDGAVIEAKTHRGYRFMRSSVKLSQSGLDALLPEYEVVYQETIDSTNRLCKQLAAEGKPEGTLVVSSFQSKGRGRLGRTFVSPTGGAYMSLLLRPQGGIEDSLLVTSAAGVAVSRAIQKLCHKETEIKWVNDVFFNQKKVTGILCEGVVSMENSSMAAIVVGIGINFATKQSEFPSDLQDIVTSLYDGEESVPSGVDANLLVAFVMQELMAIWHALPSRDFLDEYRRRSNVIGHSVFLFHKGQKERGLVHGIDDNAHLLVHLDSGEDITVGTGEVTLRVDHS